MNPSTRIPVIDLFSGAGGMSCGFARHPRFRISGAVDFERHKPSQSTHGHGCNRTYLDNIGARPLDLDLSQLSAFELASALGLRAGRFNGVLIACPPCTDFSRANPQNHTNDGERNFLTSRLKEILRLLRPKYFVYENAREAWMGNHRHHLESVLHVMRSLSYSTRIETVNFRDYGLPQSRERVLVLAARDRSIPTLTDCWDGFALRKRITVRDAFTRLAKLGRANIQLDSRFPKLTPAVNARLAAIPSDGGSWADLIDEHPELLIPSMRRKIELGMTGSYADVYGRLKWDQVAPTIKRECSHVGNGRYSHPCHNRLVTVSEMAFLQGFPADYVFRAPTLADAYRQIGDAVPPLISHQLAVMIASVETGSKFSPSSSILSHTALHQGDICERTPLKVAA